MIQAIKNILIENAAAELKTVFLRCSEALENAREIRLRQGLPLAIRAAEGDFFISQSGNLQKTPKGAFLPSAMHITDMVEKLYSHSLYAFDNEIKNGYITISGGHRVGLCGRVAVENGHIKTIKHVSGLSVRVARQVIGAADHIMPYIYNSEKMSNTIIISPPGHGKTTMLRDAVRRLSNAGNNVAVIDERSEIAACHLGAAQMDLGWRTDVIDAAPKAMGMMMALRALSPQIIAVDEIGGKEDVEAVATMVRCGISVLCTLHGRDMADVADRENLSPLLKDGVFERFIFLKDKPKPGSIAAIYDENHKKVGNWP